MKPVFVDTGAWYAAANRRDAHHQEAAGFLRDSKRPLLTTNYVVLETANLLNARAGHAMAALFLDQARQSRMLSIHHVGHKLHDEARALFQRHADKRWSLTDCASFALMTELGLTEAFSFDQHFTQAGFLRVP